MTDGSVEEIGALWHKSYSAPQRLQLQVLDVCAVEKNAPLLRRMEPHQELDKCGFARAILACYRHGFTSWNAEIQALEGWLAVVIGKGNTVEDDVAVNRLWNFAHEKWFGGKS